MNRLVDVEKIPHPTDFSATWLQRGDEALLARARWEVETRAVRKPNDTTCPFQNIDNSGKIGCLGAWISEEGHQHCLVVVQSNEEKPWKYTLVDETSHDGVASASKIFDFQELTQ